MIKALIYVNERLVSDSFKINHKGLRPIKVQVGPR